MKPFIMFQIVIQSLIFVIELLTFHTIGREEFIAQSDWTAGSGPLTLWIGSDGYIADYKKSSLAWDCWEGSL
jgi:hypothetical protein